MSNLINGRTPDEIKRALRLCNTESVGNCKAYYADCDDQPGTDALAYIESLEEKTSRFNCLLATLLDTMNALASAQPKWISVEERLPEYKTAVLGYGLRESVHGNIDPFPAEHIVYTKGEGEGWFTFRNKEYVKVTHWMPLPEPPEVEG